MDGNATKEWTAKDLNKVGEVIVSDLNECTLFIVLFTGGAFS